MTARKRHWVKLEAEEEWFENERRRIIYPIFFFYILGVLDESANMGKF